MDFVTVSKSPNQAEAEVVRSQLEANGFTVNLKDDKDALSFGYGATIGQVEVQVPEDQAASARVLLKSEESSGS
jgi:hypothetical protein